MRYLMMAAMLLLSACIQLGGEPQSQSYFLLQPLNRGEIAPLPGSSTINISHISIPAYLDRSQIVTFADSNKVTINDKARWAEPLQENIARVVQSNLSQLLPDARINSGPWQPVSAETWKLTLNIHRFSATPGEKTVLNADWLIWRDGRKIQGHFDDARGIDSKTENMVQALNQQLNLLSSTIAKDLAKL